MDETWELEKAECATHSFRGVCDVLGFVLLWHSECKEIKFHLEIVRRGVLVGGTLIFS